MSIKGIEPIMNVLAESPERPECKHHPSLWVLCGLIIFLFSTVLSALTYERFKQVEVRQLIVDVQEIRIDMASEDELRTLLQKYGGTFYAASGHAEPKRTDGRYQLRISSPFFITRNHFFHMMWQRPWAVLA
jgi:hypothetical protein